MSDERIITVAGSVGAFILALALLIGPLWSYVPTCDRVPGGIGFCRNPK